MNNSNVSLPDSTTVQRVRKLLEEAPAATPKAFFLHLCQSQILPQLFQTLECHGINQRNTVFVVVGDHGFPDYNYEQTVKDSPAYVSHDRGAGERDFRVICFLGYPECQPTRFDAPAMATDLAPTVAALLGLNPTHALPKAEGLDLTPFLHGQGTLPARTLRIDNRFIEQQQLKFSCLLNETHRYVFRWGDEWSDHPYYGYRLHAVPGREELYTRSDIDGQDNLAASPAHLSVLQHFRACFTQSESDLIRHHYPNDLFRYPPLREASQNPLPTHLYPPGGAFSLCWNRVVAGLALLLRRQLTEQGITQPVLYGADRDAVRLLSCGVFTRDDFAAVVDDPHGPQLLDNVFQPAELNDLAYDGVVLCSRRMEAEHLRRCKKWKRPEAAVFSLFRELLPEQNAPDCLPVPDAETASRLASRPAALYGAGGRAQDFLTLGRREALGIDVRLVLDGDPAKEGTRLQGLPVRCVSNLSERELSAQGIGSVLIASTHHRDILSLIRTWKTAGLDLYVIDAAQNVHPVTEPLNGFLFPHPLPQLSGENR